MSLFCIKKYIEPDKSSDLEVWYNELDDAGKAVFAARMEYLTAQKAENWNMPYFRQLDHGISEIRFKCKKVQQRPLGYFGPNRGEYTFLFPAKEKGDKFIPTDAITRARERKHIVGETPERSNVWNIRIDQ